MTLVDGKTYADVVGYLTDAKKTRILKNDSDISLKNEKPLEVSENKISVDYDDLDTKKFDMEEVFKVGKLTSSWVEPSNDDSENYLGSLRKYFNEIKDLNPKLNSQEGDVLNITAYYFTVKGAKDSSSFDLRVISVDLSFNNKEKKHVKTPVVKNEYIKEIKLS
ncbi:hypothetical protein [Spiroplasma turonicum]|uniref:Uncharacterized protein n=1 Tax=Spiroplasma turonicum TaxID=216946 RepID=A0A0K1P7C8_9MOLU|nr:hypothetical protein [Spiroplasma turonicum]AKU80205.1 hypothetical protein STURON_00959 [Spiroplasma turonicum]ALX71205.1 hypothetical protein STURO_v1c09540 [Spiroplasma turonicum]